MNRKTTLGLALALAAAALIILGGSTMSLATDLGYTDEGVEHACLRDCPRLVAALEATGFPHATTADRELYVLRVGDDVKQVIAIDWKERDAAVVAGRDAVDFTQWGTLPETTLTLSPGAYADLVTTLQGYANGEHGRGTTSVRLVALWLQTGITLDDGNTLDELAYRGKITTWAAKHGATA